ncbi:MAG: hypothetical protein FWF87_04500 [Synergistaceae bacterium]|nr:hypothetical protein [Synergistaceae bacterium]
MFNKLKEASIVDIQINMTAYLTYIMFFAFVVMFFLPHDFLMFLSIAAGLFIANWPLLPFFIEVKLDKTWILSVIKVEFNNAAPKKKKRFIKYLKFLPYESVIIFLIILYYTGLSIEHSIVLVAVTLWIFLTIRMITQVMGFYTYWIARINGDPTLKENVQDIKILEKTLKTARANYRGAWFFIVLLFLSLLVYLFSEYISQASQDARFFFTLYSLLIFLWIVQFLILGQLFDKNVVLLYITRSAYYDDLCAVVVNSMQKRLFFMKHLLGLFLFMEVIVMPVIFKTIL